jgi:Na+/H+ antiporter NhaD/arsenite permease-like protein
MPKILISLGVLLIIIGLAWQIGGKFIPIGKLPGDIIVKRGNMTFYFPVMTSIIISVVLSIILFLFTRFR